MSDHTYDPDQRLPDSLWLPRNWTLRPSPPGPISAAWMWSILAATALYNPLLNLVLPEGSHILANLAFAILLVWVALKAGASWDNLGLRVDQLGKGTLVGLVVTAFVLLGVVILTGLPASREFFADDRFVDVTGLEMIYESAIRIPFGTVLFEELVFRSVLLGLMLRRFAVWQAVTISALLFGVWHVIVAFDTIATNPAGDLIEGPVEIAGGVMATVAFTALVGYLFAWLRLRGNSLVTPVLAHIATNSFGFIAGWLVVTNGWT